MTSRPRTIGCGLLAVLALTPSAAEAATASLETRPAGFLREVVRFRGETAPGTRVVIQRRVPGRGWATTARARGGRDGRYVARWRANELGHFEVRALSGRARAAAAPSASLSVFRRVRATWYGPGLYGRQTACGQTMSEQLMGVAHRRLPCGTAVEVLHGDRAFTVPVVDRGPFANRAHYDLTAALARNLGFTGTGDVGVLPWRGRLMAPPPAPDAATVDGSGGVAPQG